MNEPNSIFYFPGPEARPRGHALREHPLRLCVRVRPPALRGAAQHLAEDTRMGQGAEIQPELFFFVLAV